MPALTAAEIIRKLDLRTMTTSLLAGAVGVAGDVDATGADARFNLPVGLALSHAAHLPSCVEAPSS